MRATELAVLAFLPGLLGCHSQVDNPSSPEVSIPQSASSNTTKNAAPEIDWEQPNSYAVKSTPPSKEIQIIPVRCAVLIYPSDEQIKSVREELGDEDSETAGDDGNFYMSEVITTLEALKVPQIVAKRRYLRLNGQRGVLIDLRKDGAPFFNLLLCSNSKPPVFKSPIDANKEFIEAYFKSAPAPKRR